VSWFSKAPAGAGSNRFAASYSGDRPAWMRERQLKATLMEGH
jgi:hypothetical protein